MDDTSSMQSRCRTVALDAMGGDHGPAPNIAGAVAAARALPDTAVILVGDESCIAEHLTRLGPAPRNLTIAHAAQVVDMCEAPGHAIRQKPQSSIAVGMRLVRDGRADAMISAGNSGATMAGAMLILKAQPGIDRPAIASMFPSRDGPKILLDAGATADCRAIHLVQFAQLGNRYFSGLFDCPRPRVGLLSIGEEPSKGNELTKETHQLLAASSLHFLGNVEPKEVTRGEVDVIVCDGFVGNLMLKASEAAGELIFTQFKEQITSSLLARCAAMLLRPVFERVRKYFDYVEYGGALLLGVNGVVVICHGRSNALAIENAIRVAARAVERRLGVPLTEPPARDLLNSVTG